MPFSVKISSQRCKFSASHFLYNHEKCSRLHGHNYDVQFEIIGDLDEHFFVVDFFEVKKRVSEIVDNLDHAVLIAQESKFIKITKEKGQIKVDFNQKHYEFPEVDVRLLPLPATTAECLAKYFYDKLKPQFPKYKMKVDVGESEGSVASYTE